ncbi:MAG: hypothetical protein JSV06_11405 [Myxococcales bacterium]|nr:MAG: hypothetical protein JSV06_11405 [Myxococcales bacterium]
MTTPCPHGVSPESWIDFFAGDLDEETGQRLEELLFECPQCAAEAERWGAIAGSSAEAIPPVIATDTLRALQTRGETITENAMQPGESRRAFFPDGGRLLIHRLQGLDLGSADSVNLALSTSEGAPLARFEDVPFDRDAGEVIVACQRHFGESFPPEIRFEVERCRVDQREVVAEYQVDHADWHGS